MRQVNHWLIGTHAYTVSHIPLKTASGAQTNGHICVITLHYNNQRLSQCSGVDVEMLSIKPHQINAVCGKIILTFTQALRGFQGAS